MVYYFMQNISIQTAMYQLKSPLLIKTEQQKLQPLDNNLFQVFV